MCDNNISVKSVKGEAVPYKCYDENRFHIWKFYTLNSIAEYNIYDDLTRSEPLYDRIWHHIELSHVQYDRQENRGHSYCEKPIRP